MWTEQKLLRGQWKSSVFGCNLGSLASTAGLKCRQKDDLHSRSQRYFSLTFIIYNICPNGKQLPIYNTCLYENNCPFTTSAQMETTAHLQHHVKLKHLLINNTCLNGNNCLFTTLAHLQHLLTCPFMTSA